MARNTWRVGGFYMSRAGVLAAVALLLGACASEPLYPPLPIQPEETDLFELPYRFQRGDELLVRVGSGKHVNVRETIDEDGRLALPQIEPVIAAEKTYDQLRGALTTAYRRLYRDAMVTVSVAKSTKRAVYVWGGNTRKWGRVDLKGPTTYMQLMAEISPREDPDQLPPIVVLRGDPQKPTVYTVDLHAIYTGATPDPAVQPGDGILVGKSKYRKVERAVGLWGSFWSGTLSARDITDNR